LPLQYSLPFICQFEWIVLWLPLRYSLTFINSITNVNLVLFLTLFFITIESECFILTYDEWK
jgi:hypothetical protein